MVGIPESQRNEKNKQQQQQKQYKQRTMNMVCARKGEKKIESSHTTKPALWQMAELDWYYNAKAQNERRINKRNKIILSGQHFLRCPHLYKI